MGILDGLIRNQVLAATTPESCTAALMKARVFVQKADTAALAGAFGRMAHQAIDQLQAELLQTDTAAMGAALSAYVRSLFPNQGVGSFHPLLMLRARAHARHLLTTEHGYTPADAEFGVELVDDGEALAKAGVDPVSLELDSAPPTAGIWQWIKDHWDVILKVALAIVSLVLLFGDRPNE